MTPGRGKSAAQGYTSDGAVTSTFPTPLLRVLTEQIRLLFQLFSPHTLHYTRLYGASVVAGDFARTPVQGISSNREVLGIQQNLANRCIVQH
jgi:hypothetical protein